MVRDKNIWLNSKLVRNSVPCNNTVLAQIVTPFFSFDKTDEETTVEMAKIGGEYISCFDATKPYEIISDFNFITKDFCGFVKSPFGNKYNYKFLLFTILCQINFIVYSVDKFIVDETSTKLRSIKKTWYEFRDKLKNGEFTYTDTEKAMETTFLKVFNDLFNTNHGINQIIKKWKILIFQWVEALD